MSFAVVLFEINDQKLKEQGYQFDTELNWLVDSGIFAKAIYPIPNELKDLDAIEVLWLMRQVEENLRCFEEEGKIEKTTNELIIELVKEIYNDHESVDQDIAWRVENYLKQKGIINE
ncbi:hypothetical protein [Parageobacillus galactosidasius]|uniref:Uncharacterized protein n=1 Tax=Parageobacillus galactosidasius TaxID=883812 RepID=A0A226QSK9_9BACL|nr:hypothetical protein [Parageobacillus galactosidasius]OXB94888.1 hypothetical protein B9L23_08475 [Parageobacillus galactosidasius]